MRNYDKWDELQGLKGKVVIRHSLFGEQRYECDELQVVNDDKRIGVVVKGAVLFVYKQKLVEFCASGNVYTVGDDLQEIEIVVNKM